MREDAESLERLVEAAREGDRRAFAQLYRAHGRMVHGLLLTRLPRSELRDALQDVFVAALARIASLREPARFGPWLAAIARNHARDYFKRHGTTREVACDPLDFQTATKLVQPSPETSVLDRLALLGHMRALPEDYRELLILRFAEGLSGPEIAQLLGMTPGSVRVKLSRGVAMLRAKVGDER